MLTPEIYIDDIKRIRDLCLNRDEDDTGFSSNNFLLLCLGGSAVTWISPVVGFPRLSLVSSYWNAGPRYISEIYLFDLRFMLPSRILYL